MGEAAKTLQKFVVGAALFTINHGYLTTGVSYKVTKVTKFPNDVKPGRSARAVASCRDEGQCDWVTHGQMEKCADKEVQVGVNKPTGCTSVMGSGPRDCERFTGCSVEKGNSVFKRSEKTKITPKNC